MQFSLRPATEQDLEKIFEIEKKVQKAPWTLDHLRSELGKPYSHFLVLTDDETDEIVLGYLVYWTLSNVVQLLNVAVDLDYRGLGCAKHMMRHLLKESFQSGLEKVVLEVRKSNQAALFLYQKHGFTVSRIKKSYYSDGEDAYEMEFLLQGPIVPF